MGKRRKKAFKIESYNCWSITRVETNSGKGKSAPPFIPVFAQEGAGGGACSFMRTKAKKSSVKGPEAKHTQNINVYVDNCMKN